MSSIPIQVLLYWARLLFMYGVSVFPAGSGCDAMMARASIVLGPRLLLCGDMFGVLQLIQVDPIGKNVVDV